MTNVAILPERSDEGGTVYRAIAGRRQAVAPTAGTALDALAAQLSPDERGTLVIVQTQKPDRFFTETQQRRLQSLMRRWREAREGGPTLSVAEENELNLLIDAEVQASGERAAAGYQSSA